MHLELPRVSLHSMKEFASHYLMIVVSILTALGLEALIENAHHRHAAEAAREAIVAEIRQNIEGVHDAVDKDRKRLVPLEQFGDTLRKALVDGVPAPRVSAIIAQHVQAGIDVGLHYPELHREAWDVAVANQSASWMDATELRRLSAAYTWPASDRASDLALFFDAPRFVSAITDARVGAADPREFLRVLDQAAAALRSTVNRYEAIEFSLKQALVAPAAAASH
jgi:hypothetical protein